MLLEHTIPYHINHWINISSVSTDFVMNRLGMSNPINCVFSFLSGLITGGFNTNGYPLIRLVYVRLDDSPLPLAGASSNDHYHARNR